MSKMLSKDSAEKGKSDIKWDDVIGMENAKRDAWEIVQFIKDAKQGQSHGRHHDQRRFDGRPSGLR